jgi:hypothetical protein
MSDNGTVKLVTRKTHKEQALKQAQKAGDRSEDAWSCQGTSSRNSSRSRLFENVTRTCS